MLRYSCTGHCGAWHELDTRVAWPRTDPDEEVELLSPDEAQITEWAAETRASKVTLVHDLTYECGVANIDATCYFNQRERPISGPGNLSNQEDAMGI
jgi:hypothetical protein